ncbi:MAG: DUF882 domain-containing protein [Desulfovibrionales bacterium]|nr:DUF882 domain-containing protein [Desulfovibrionales bacterium]
MNYSRRQFLCNIATLTLVGAAIPLAQPALAAQVGARSLSFEHMHTGKVLRVVYAMGNKYVPEGLKTLNMFLRDHYTGQVCRMDPKLFDLLFRLKRSFGGDRTFQIISAYRSPVTNTKLRASGHRGVAKHSLHMEGKALDIRLAGVSLGDLRDAAVESRSGGVGFYPRGQFVHVDTGQFRTWG